MGVVYSGQRRWMLLTVGRQIVGHTPPSALPLLSSPSYLAPVRYLSPLRMLEGLLSQCRLPPAAAGIIPPRAWRAGPDTAH